MKARVIPCLTLLSFLFASFSYAEDAGNQRIAALERKLEALASELKEVKAQLNQVQSQDRQHEDRLVKLTGQVDQAGLLAADSWVNRFEVGGYGELHANFNVGQDGKDLFDIHRLVFDIGYEFTDWIHFESEIEIEHAFVADGAGGELEIEQAYVDFSLHDAFNIRVGRILTPLGIINKVHEPPTFNGVERPSFAKYIIPTTWWSDGIGVYGAPLSFLQYEAYVVGGLDGSKFNAKDGIRKGRIKERPSFNDAAFTGRLDLFPLANIEAPLGQYLRLGLAGYWGGLDNGNKGNDPSLNADIAIYAADFEYRISRFDFRGGIAFEDIGNADKIGNGAAEEIFGWYLEGAWHWWPDAWKRGKLSRSDAVIFVRYDDYNTQHKMPSGVARDPAGDRRDWTIGLTFHLTPAFVVKADYQILDDGTDDEVDDQFNLGLGWQF